MRLTDIRFQSDFIVRLPDGRIIEFLKLSEKTWDVYIETKYNGTQLETMNVTHAKMYYESLINEGCAVVELN